MSRPHGLRSAFAAALCFAATAAFAAGIGDARAQTFQRPPHQGPHASGNAKIATSPTAIGPTAQISSLTELAASAANQRALRAPRPKFREMPKHRLPDGRTTQELKTKGLPYSPGLELGKIAPATLSNTSQANFVGATTESNLQDGAAELEPPDQGLAVYNGTVVEIINNTVMAFNSSGQVLAGPIATDVFFSIGHPGNDEFRESDPQAFYDPFVGRWFVDELIWDPSNGFAGFALAVSKSSNPLGGWYIYHVRAFDTLLGASCHNSNSTSTCLPDFPKAGYDNYGFFITADMFANFGSGSFVNALTYALPIAKLIAGQTFNYDELVLTGGGTDFVIQPSIPAFNEGVNIANGGTTFMMEARNISDGSTKVRVIAVWNTSAIPGGEKVAWTDATPGLSYGPTTPAAEPNVPGPLCTWNVHGAPPLDGVYDSFTANIIVANGNLWGILPFAQLDGNSFNRDVLGLFVINPGFNPLSVPPVNPSTVAARVLNGPNGSSTLSPTLALDSLHQTGGIGITYVNNTSLFPSQLAAPFSYALSPTFTFTLVTPLRLQAGVAADDGFTFCTKGTGSGRWGDYGQAAVDPATGYFWFGNEMINLPTQTTDGQSTNWGTNIIGFSVP